MPTRLEIITEARSWEGTMWQHQKSLKGVATDCIGFVKGVYENTYEAKINKVPTYSATWHLFKAQEVLYEAVKSYCPIEKSPENRLPGDILLFAFGKGPAHHAGILTSDTTFIHAYADFKKVVEVPLDSFWLAHLKYVFEYPEVTN